MKKLLRKLILTISSLFKGRYAGKMIGLFDFCRDVICKNEKVFAGQIHKRMALESIVPSLNCKSSENPDIEITDKIKVRIVYPSGDSWNNIHTLYEEFVKDDMFQTYVLVKDESRFVNIMQKYNCNYVTYNNYSLVQDNPDIFIYCFYGKHEGELVFPDCRRFINRAYLFIASAVMNEENNDIHWELIRKANVYMKPDIVIADPLVYNALRGYVEDSKLIEMGGCQFDEIYREVGKNHPFPVEWKKIIGKKVFLWATDHGINESYPKNGFTVDLYLRNMIEFFLEHQDYALIFRPHPQLIREMFQQKKFWSYDDVMKIKSYFESTPNIIWDETSDFCCAYDICDALIVDANCSITCSFLTTGKPICRLMRYDIREWLVSPELYDCYYYAQNFNECINFMNMIAKGEDPKEPVRKNGMEKAILHFDGMNGKRMKEFITNDYYKSTLRRVNIMN